MASEYQSDLWQELIDNNGIKHINQLESYRDYLNNNNVDSPYEEDIDNTNDTMDGYTSPLAEIDEPNTQSNNIEQNSSTDLSSEWSKKEGWSEEYFRNKVEPRLNEAYQMEYKVADNQQVNPTFKGKMSYSYNNNSRSDVKSKTTLWAIVTGKQIGRAHV